MPSSKHLDIPPAAARDKASFEVLRVWIAEQGQHVSIRSGAWGIIRRPRSGWRCRKCSGEGTSPAL